MIEHVYITSEKIDLLNEYLEKHPSLSDVDELQLSVFCEYLDIDLTLKNLNKIQVSFNNFTFEDKSLEFISKYSNEFNKIINEYYDNVVQEELDNLPDDVVDALNLNTFYENIIKEYNVFDENVNLTCIHLYIDDDFKNIYYVKWYFLINKDSKRKLE